MSEMFCFQCEQTAHGTACVSRGVCGKGPVTAGLQDDLTNALVRLALATEPGKLDDETIDLVLGGLFTTITNVDFDDADLEKWVTKINAKTNSLGVPAQEYDVNALWHANEDERSLKSLLLFGIRGAAAYEYHCRILGHTDYDVVNFFMTALRALATISNIDELTGLVLETGNQNLKAMESLNAAHKEHFGVPEPTKVSLKVEAGPFIVVTGHDLEDLYLLLEQTKDKGVSIYTHGEMLPAHGYPKLKAYSHFKGHFGTAWQNQQKEFADLPGAILFTTNCIMPVKDSYSDRVFTTNVVAYPGMVHIDEKKDFGPVIDKALELGGFSEDKQFSGINGGTELITGFGHDAVLSHAETIVGAVKAGAIKHFMLVGGCDGAAPGRNYYTDIVSQAPEGTIVLTLACGKFRFNDLNIGEIGGFPRIMDVGQCNDAYSAIRIAVALAEAFECDVNDLPLSIVLSWYEQKAVAVLLTLLALGIKNIRIGPSLPAFVSPAVLNILVDTFGVAPTTTPEADIKALIG